MSTAIAALQCIPFSSNLATERSQISEAQAEPAQEMLSAASFAEAVVVEGEGSARPGLQPTMIVELARGRQVSIFASASPAQVASVLKALR